jgi:hypothetical protein
MLLHVVIINNVKVEYTIISMDRQAQTARLSLRGHEILESFDKIEKEKLDRK